MVYTEPLPRYGQALDRLLGQGNWRCRNLTSYDTIVATWAAENVNELPTKTSLDAAEAEVRADNAVAGAELQARRIADEIVQNNVPWLTLARGLYSMLKQLKDAVNEERTVRGQAVIENTAETEALKAAFSAAEAELLALQGQA